MPTQAGRYTRAEPMRFECWHVASSKGLCREAWSEVTWTAITIIAQSPILGTTITVKRLTRRGYESMLNYYLEITHTS
jgi:hypothetical protein